MSVPRKDKPLLAPTEKDRLKNPPTDSNIRKRNNIIVKRKIQYWLNAANDVLYALDHLTDTKIENVFSDSEIFTLFNLIEKLLDRLNYAPIHGNPEHPYVAWTEIRGDVLARRRYRAKESDFERNWRVQELVKYLKLCYPSDPEKESPAYKKYRVKRENKELREQCKAKGFREPDFLPGEEDED